MKHMTLLLIIFVLTQLTKAQIIEPVDSLQWITFQNFSGSIVILKWNNPEPVTVSISSSNSIVFPGDRTLLIRESVGTAIAGYAIVPVFSVPLDSILQISFQASVTGVKKQNNIVPKDFSVSQNYPNPFNPSTIISYALPKLSLVTIKIYNILGKEVRTLFNSMQRAGNYTVQWNADNNIGHSVTSGVYICQVVAGHNVKSITMMYLK
ncbi:MAG: T9SS type A sorting domain-containing protein [Ignavibacteriaceae bacterium]